MGIEVCLVEKLWLATYGIQLCRPTHANDASTFPCQCQIPISFKLYDNFVRTCSYDSGWSHGYAAWESKYALLKSYGWQLMASNYVDLPMQMMQVHSLVSVKYLFHLIQFDLN